MRARNGAVRASIGVAVLLTSWASWCVPALRAAPPLTFPLRAHVPAWNAAPAEAFLDAQLAAANLLFSTHGVQFVMRERVALEGARTRLRGTYDLLRLQPLLDRSRIDVFAVSSIRLRASRSGATTIGVCSPRVAGLHPAVVISTTAVRHTLAHELGHYFGLEHSAIPGNLMWPTSDSGTFLPTALSLDAAQGVVIGDHARRFARDGAPAAIAEP